MDFQIGSAEIIGTAAFLGACGTIYASILQVRKRLILPVKSWLARIDRVCETLGPNGGSSLHDKITAIDRRSAVAEARGVTLTDSAGVGEWQSSTSGVCTYISRNVCRRTGRAESEFLGHEWRNVIHPEDVERVEDEWNAAVREGRSFSLRYRWTHSDGHSIPIRATASPLRIGAGVLVGWIASVVFEEDEGK